jgi:hypothetical protein
MFLTSTYLKRSHDSDMKEENVAIVRNMRLTDLKRSNLILDLKKKEVVKCRDYQMEVGKVVENPNYDDLYNHFHAQYPDHLDAAINVLNHEEK